MLPVDVYGLQDKLNEAGAEELWEILHGNLLRVDKHKGQSTLFRSLWISLFLYLLARTADDGLPDLELLRAE